MFQSILYYQQYKQHLSGLLTIMNNINNIPLKYVIRSITIYRLLGRERFVGGFVSLFAASLMIRFNSFRSIPQCKKHTFDIRAGTEGVRSYGLLGRERFIVCKWFRISLCLFVEDQLYLRYEHRLHHVP